MIALKFSALKRIKTFSRNCMSEERLTNLAIIAIEKKTTVRIATT